MPITLWAYDVRGLRPRRVLTRCPSPCELMTYEAYARDVPAPVTCPDAMPITLWAYDVRGLRPRRVLTRCPSPCELMTYEAYARDVS
ncbi:hypothetical protein NDU88_000719 [Pleurodeles waltl]|uniref:Uncharacterized protein n=1 Tax=Pleurodeles waltl TaxID=8319 RepID=A0AAV7V7A9_PLEWA|nr:hypothetical protein NDU88_000719 [Pleurodeles waltl]